MFRRMRIVRKNGETQDVRIWTNEPDLHNMRIVVDQTLRKFGLSLTDVRNVFILPRSDDYAV